MASFLAAMTSAASVPARKTAVRPLLRLEAGAHAHARSWLEAEAAAEDEGRPVGAPSAEQDPGERPRPDADEPAEEQAPIAFSPEFLAQVLGQVAAPGRSAEEFSEAARAYQALQAKEPLVLFLDEPEHIDFDA